MVLRDAVPDDALAISVLDGERNGVDPASIVDRIRAHLASDRDRHHVLVAEVDRVVVGFGRVGWLEPKPEHHNLPRGWYLLGIVVGPGARRRGVGHALVDARLRRAADAGAVEVFYVTNTLNQASVALHRSFGFEEVTRDFTPPSGASPEGESLLLRAGLDPG